MKTNPYSPPDAEVKSPPTKAWSPVASILLGLTIDVGGILLAGALIGLVYGEILLRSGASAEEIEWAGEQLFNSFWMTILSFILGCMCSFLGGMACARVSRSSNYKLGVILGVISVAVQLTFFPASSFFMKDVILKLISFAFIVLGTNYGIAKNARQRKE